MGKVIIVSNRLPLKIQKKDKEIIYKASEGGLATGLSSVYKNKGNIWMGWPGMYLLKESDKKNVRQKLASQNMLPVFLTKKEIREYYEGFSNETLWPTFHYFPQYSVYEKTFWEAYYKVNQKFANEVLKVVEEGDTIWIHDYQLMLVPWMIREKLNTSDIKIGFFLHIPFPSSEIFRLLPWRGELIKGLLGADLIGFHTHDYMQHFLNAVWGSLNLPNTGGAIEYEGRTVMVDAFPMGIDYEKYANTAKSAKALKSLEKFRNTIGPQKIILSIDRLDYTKGIPQRLKAFEDFLKAYPEFREKVSLLQILVPSRDKVSTYTLLKEEINRLVGNINSTYSTLGWTPVYYFYRSFPEEALSAFYMLADVAMVTPLRDGMNLVAKEYVASRIMKKGVLVLSEMAGAAIELTDALFINPNDQEQMVKAIYEGLTMPARTQEKKMEAMQLVVSKFNIHHWVKMFMQRLDYAKENQHRMQTQLIRSSQLKTFREKFASSNKRLLVLDYDGTLVGFQDTPAKAKPDERLLQLLRELSKIENTRILIISGRDKPALEKWFGHLKIDLIAEHGIWLKYGDTEWETIESSGTAWKDNISSVLTEYLDRTPGAFIEEKEYSLVWHYRKVAPGLARLRLHELHKHLGNLIGAYNLQLLEGDKVLEVKNAEINKGRAVSRWLEKYAPDFICAIGDDVTDEDIFRVLPPDAITIKVRGTVSIAGYNLPSHREVRSFLKNILSWEQVSVI